MPMPRPFDAGQIELRLKAVREEKREAAGRGLFLATEHVLGVARDRVPIEEGTLERSGATHVDEENLVGHVFFDTEYAVRQHEDLTLQHDAGREAKYLESALTGEKETVRKIIADEIRKG